VIQGAFAVLSIALAHGLSAASNSPPNVLLILADDLGYGDVDALNSKSKISTPNIDELARQGITFTDAHSAAVCIPSRYELLTGRYLFRSHRVFNSQALIEPGRVTLASVLKSAGYATAMIGKWHLSFEGGTAFDYSQPLRGGPVDHGFDSYFGIPASPDEPPYFYIENDRAVEAPTAAVGTHSSADFRFIQGEFWEGGPIAPRFRHDQVLTKLAHRAVAFILSILFNDGSAYALVTRAFLPREERGGRLRRFHHGARRCRRPRPRDSERSWKNRQYHRYLHERQWSALV
jgi:arylsulfatase A